LGGYVGASLGGLTYDKIGFENGTTVVVALQVLLVVVVSLYLSNSLFLSFFPSLSQTQTISPFSANAILVTLSLSHSRV
jgi:hypothetical protein